MAIYTDNLETEVRLEYMRPEQIDAARERLPAIYFPFGAMEWHGYHNPVGLDALKAHEQLVGLAARVGGVVYPAIYFGVGGGHKEWPGTYMVDGDAMTRIATDLLCRAEANGYRKAILISGHYPNKGDFMEQAAEDFHEDSRELETLVLVECELDNVDGDHAAKNETSFLLHLHPSTVDMARLDVEPRDDIGPPDERINWMGQEFDGHPCYGLVGIDPRTHATADTGRVYTDRLLDFLADWVSNG